jgi:hypothetical protein
MRDHTQSDTMDEIEHTIYSGVCKNHYWFIKCSCGYERFQKGIHYTTEQTPDDLKQEHLTTV